MWTVPADGVRGLSAVNSFPMRLRVDEKGSNETWLSYHTSNFGKYASGSRTIMSHMENVID